MLPYMDDEATRLMGETVLSVHWTCQTCGCGGTGNVPQPSSGLAEHRALQDAHQAISPGCTGIAHANA